MKFLLDVNLPPSLGQRLTRSGHEAAHAGKLGLGKAADETVLSAAMAAGSVLLTHDLDFGKLMAFSGKDAPSIVIFRLQKLNAAVLENLLVRHWPLIQAPLAEGALVVIEENDIRIRRLPIGGTRGKGGPILREPQAGYRAGPGKKPKAGVKRGKRPIHKGARRARNRGRGRA